MRLPLTIAVLVAALFAAGALVDCGSSSNATDGGQDAGQDAGMDAGGDAGPVSACGQPGDMNNDAGVGMYCTKPSQCTVTGLCSTLGNGARPANQQTFFCTKECGICSPPGFCGYGASCVYDPVLQAWGCVPDTCSALFPDGGNPSCPDAGDGG